MISPHNKKGFSLVELLVVMAIMITLGGIGYQAMSGNKVIARDTARKQALGNLQDALESYYAKNNFYPQPAIQYWDELGDAEHEILNYRNLWGYLPEQGETFEAIPSCKLAWDSENNTLDYNADLEAFNCGGVVYDRSGEVVVGWKGTLTEFSGKNSISNPSKVNPDGEIGDVEFINPLTHREYIVAPFDKTYFQDDIPKDPALAGVPDFEIVGIGPYVYSAYRKGIDTEEGKNTAVGASQYQLAATLENTEEGSVDGTAYVIGNYIRKTKKYTTRIGDENIDTYAPYSLIGSRNAVIMNGEKIDEGPSFEACPESDRHTDKLDDGEPCAIENFTNNTDIEFDGTRIDSGYMGVPYPVVF